MLLDFLGRTYSAPADDTLDSSGGDDAADTDSGADASESAETAAPEKAEKHEPQSPYDFTDGTPGLQPRRRRSSKEDAAESPADKPSDKPAAKAGAKASTEKTADSQSPGDGRRSVDTPAASTGSVSPPVTAPQYDKALAQRAMDLGIPGHEVAALLSDGDLLRHRVAVRENEIRQWQEQQYREQAAQQTQQDYFSPIREQIKRDLIAKGFEENDPTMEAMVNGLEQLHQLHQQREQQLVSHFQNQFTEFQNRLGQVDQLNQQHQQLSAQQQQAMRAHQQAQAEVEVNRFFADQPEEWQAVFGQGGLNDLDQSSAEYQARLKLIEHAAGLSRAGIGGSPAERLEMAKYAVFHPQLETIARKRVADRARNAQGQFQSRPTAEEPATERLSPRERALKLEREWKQRHGFAVSAQHGDPVV